MATSKSLFTNSLVLSGSRSLYNPVSFGYNGGGFDDAILLNESFVKTLRIISEFYGNNMALKNYENIPNDYNSFVAFYVTLQKVILRTVNPQLRTLFKLAQDTLVGAINTYTIYGDNLILRLDKTNLQNKVNEILSNKNEKLIELPNTTGQLNVKKSFKLAAVFNNYILIYGCPAYGVGFDPVKIKFLADVLKKRGVNPYA
jgi:hypothetical protein